MKIGFDLDGVIAKFNTAFINYLNNQLGSNFTVDNLNSYNYTESLKISSSLFKETFENFSKGGNFKYLQTHKLFLKAINNLSVENQIYFITKRNLSMVNDTYNWFMNKNISFQNGLFFTDDKPPIAKYLGLEVFVEDCYDNAMNLSKVVDKVFLINRPWNINEKPLEPNIERINGRLRLENYVRENNIKYR